MNDTTPKTTDHVARLLLALRDACRDASATDRARVVLGRLQEGVRSRVRGEPKPASRGYRRIGWLLVDLLRDAHGIDATAHALLLALPATSDDVFAIYAISAGLYGSEYPADGEPDAARRGGYEAGLALRRALDGLDAADEPSEVERPVTSESPDHVARLRLALRDVCDHAELFSAECVLLGALRVGVESRLRGEPIEPTPGTYRRVGGLLLGALRDVPPTDTTVHAVRRALLRVRTHRSRYGTHPLDAATAKTLLDGASRPGEYHDAPRGGLRAVERRAGAMLRHALDRVCALLDGTGDADAPGTEPETWTPPWSSGRWRAKGVRVTRGERGWVTSAEYDPGNLYPDGVRTRDEAAANARLMAAAPRLLAAVVGMLHAATSAARLDAVEYASTVVADAVGEPAYSLDAAALRERAES